MPLHWRAGASAVPQGQEASRGSRISMADGADLGVKVSAVCPDYIETRIPMKQETPPSNTNFLLEHG
jgi:hypothetical protein